MLTDIDHSIDIDVSRERVWTAMTDEGLVEQWLGCLQFRPVLGSLFYMQPDPAKRAAGDIAGATHCELQAMDAPETMVFTWFIPGTPKTHVTIELTAIGPNATRARLVHSGWDQFNPDDIRAIRDMLDGGWSSHVLPGLKQVAEAT